MKAIGFDLGETLICYPNVPLNWSTLYKDAISRVQTELGVSASSELQNQALEILSRYNTRENPRDFEVTDTEIFREILKEWGISDDTHLSHAIETFFSYFQKDSHLYPDTLSTLKTLKERNVKIGLLTDVPYGMDKQFVFRDIRLIQAYIDVIVTSVDVGYRKTRMEGFYFLSEKMGIDPHDMIYVGNENKDIVGANCAGMKSVLIDRDGGRNQWGQTSTIRNLRELIIGLV
ncbi:HAD family hydrolase [Paenibacillus sp. GCM10012303]|uniref:HAD family hydrolase n=1 Tax=Paenibacillus sp. GCM10012303 TaxID=3317340 RepID=UPI0036245BA4